MSDFRLEPTGVVPAPRHTGSPVWKILTVLLAVACAVLAFLVWRPDGEASAGTGPTGSADSAAALACEILDEVETEGVELASDEGFVTQSRLGVVASLGWLAFAQDQAFPDVRDALEAPTHAAASTFSVTGPEFRSAMERAQKTCAELPDA